MRTSARALWVVALLGVACGGGAPEASSADRARARRAPSARSGGVEPAALNAAELARVPSRTFGPYLSQSGDAALVVWASLGDGEGQFKGLTLSVDGKPQGAARALGEAPQTLRLIALRPRSSGFVLVYTSTGAEGEGVTALCLDAKGVPAGPASVLASLPGRAMWVEAVPVANGTLIFHGALADATKRVVEIGVVPLDGTCRAGERSTLVRDARAWQAVSSGDGALLAVVRATSGAGGNVEALAVDANGKLRSTTPVSSEASAEADIDAARIGDNVVLAWTDRRSIEPRLFRAVVDASGKVAAPASPLTPAEGEQALLQLVAPAAGARVGYVAWENLSERRPPGGRVFRVASVDSTGRVGEGRARLEYASLDGLAPELSASPRGLAALTIAPLCGRQEACDGSRVAPTFVELDATFKPIAAEPLRLAPLRAAVAEHGFNLSCTKRGCLALAALRREPAPVFAVQLEPRSPAFRPPADAMQVGDAPRVLEHEAVTRVPSCAAIALESVAGQQYLATITDFDPTTPWRRLDRPAPDGRWEPLRAQIALERVNSAGKAAQAVRASPISLRAHSLGGVTLAPGNPDRGDMLVAWAGVDQGVPQVFLTLVGKSGDRIAQRMLTRKKGDLSDVAAVWVGDGWVVSWVDDRFGDLEVFAAKIDARLNSVGPERRITEAAGAAAELALAYDGSTVRVVWSDARAADEPGHADIYSAVLNPKDATRVGGEVRLAATRAHSFSPGIQPFDGGFWAAWAERGFEDGEAGSVAIVSIGKDGSVSRTESLSTGGAEPRSIGLSCDGGRCRLAAILERHDQASLAVATFGTASRADALTPVLPLLGTAGASVPPVLSGDEVFFVDGDANEARVRRARLAWEAVE